MAKYYISADLEGVCGVTSLLQCYPKSDLTGFHAAVRQMAAEVNAVAETLLELDPDAKIVVNDAHSTMTNLGLEHLLPQVELLSGKPKICSMMAGLDRSFQAAFLIGYHAKAGTEKASSTILSTTNCLMSRLTGYLTAKVGLTPSMPTGCIRSLS